MKKNKNKRRIGRTRRRTTTRSIEFIEFIAKISEKSSIRI
jgi:hypothetical protein